MKLPLFALLIIERDPYVFGDLPGLFQSWLQDAGGFAAVGLFAYIIYALNIPSAQSASAKNRANVTGFMLIMAVLSLIGYAAYVGLVLTGKGYDTTKAFVNYSEPGAYIKYVAPKFSTNLQPLTLMFSGLFAFLGIGQPFVQNVFKLRVGRIYALAKLGFKEALRSKLPWVFLICLLPFLFPAKWYFQIKPENELRSIVSISSFVTNLNLLIPAGLIAAFSIPRDIRDQNIYTIVTKPVERFEIIFGRFLGYAGLLSLALLFMTTAGWLYIYTTGVDEKAAIETYKARVPVRGSLGFASRKSDFQGTNVGREFDYRKYIAGDSASPQRAIWSYKSIPTGLTTGREFVPCEMSFDIFRMTKGQENRGVDLLIRVYTQAALQVPPVEQAVGAWRWADPELEKKYEDEAKDVVRKLRNLGPNDDVNPASVFRFAEPGKPEWEALNKLTEKYGFFEISGKEIFDYHTESVNIPVGIFKNAVATATDPEKPALQISVKCQTGGQMLGMAEGDLYILEGQRRFAENYFKNALGLWCRMMILVGIAIVLSTYLAGVVSLLGAKLLFLFGYFSEHILDLSTGQSSAGGPIRAMSSLLNADTPTAQPDTTKSLVKAQEFIDGNIFSWIVRRFVNMIPDVDAFSWSTYLSEGFNIPLESLIINILMVVAYLLPWFILSFYLLRSREVAE
ncbi:MAG: ABC transporter permease [Fimbriiglobus sp.]